MVKKIIFWVLGLSFLIAAIVFVIILHVNALMRDHYILIDNLKDTNEIRIKIPVFSQMSFILNQSIASDQGGYFLELKNRDNGEILTIPETFKSPSGVVFQCYSDFRNPIHLSGATYIAPGRYIIKVFTKKNTEFDKSDRLLLDTTAIWKNRKNKKCYDSLLDVN